MKSNIDISFTRRFNAIIEFTSPDARERYQLWKNYLPSTVKIDERLNIEEIARKYQLTGANIVNVIQYAGLRTLENESPVLSVEELLQGIRKEYEKEGKLLRQE